VWGHSNTAFIKNVLQMGRRENKRNSNIFLQRQIFQRKMSKKSQKGQTNFLRPINLRWCQKTK